ncbi:hypothetical protein T06_2960 [Trichinella sp. T6]|nr:hypothetical protein T06_2960 [Trichinella sp. T6]
MLLAKQRASLCMHVLLLVGFQLQKCKLHMSSNGVKCENGEIHSMLLTWKAFSKYRKLQMRFEFE